MQSVSGISGYQGVLWHRRRRAWYGSLQAEYSVFTLQLSVFILIVSDSILPTFLSVMSMCYVLLVSQPDGESSIFI